jgi:mono/diheme cytochrome c family protein
VRRPLLIGAGAVVAAGIAGAAAFAYWPAGPAPAMAMPAITPELIARGQYVTTAADCVSCHTVPGGTPFAGGRPFKLPFGTIYAPNITPDRQTGIGGWSAGQFVRAVKDGVRNDGQEIYPALPYTSYHLMSDADVLAVKAYLDRLAPARAPNRQNSLGFPFNQRAAMRFWKLLFMPRHGFQADPSRGLDWNRGAYLATAAAHCGECHSPRNILYGISGAPQSGETLSGWTAWNITPDGAHGIGSWSTDEIANYLKYGYAPGHAVAGGPMKEAIDNSLSKLTDEDLRAIAVYLKAVKPSDRGPSVEGLPASVTSSTLAAPGPGEKDSLGRRIFAGNCAGCHSWNGQGMQTQMTQLNGLRSVRDPHAFNVMQTILHGGAVNAPQGRQAMPSFHSAYSNEEIAALAGYVVQHFGGADARVKPKQVAKAREAE